MKKIDIIATIGPASVDLDILRRMQLNGMTIARINTKYGTLDQYQKITEHIRKIGRCKILFDIKGISMIPNLKHRKFDFLAVSFAESALQIHKIRKLLNKPEVKIIAKIESRKGLNNIDGLINAADGIMVARGDLGRNLPIEKVPFAQKFIIKKCNKKNRMVITATEMLLSMTHRKTPERAEVSDIANAVLDGSNAVMLSEETSIGKYPALTVEMMHRVVKATLAGMHHLR